MCSRCDCAILPWREGSDGCYHHPTRLCARSVPGRVKGLGSLFQFIVQSVRLSIGQSIASVVLLGMGIDVEAIVRTFTESPPPILLEWWVPYLFVIVAVLLLAHVFMKQVDWLNRSGPRPNVSVFWLFHYLHNVSAWALGRSYDEGKIAFEVEREIRDAAAAGRITFWGAKWLPPLNA